MMLRYRHLMAHFAFESETCDNVVSVWDEGQSSFFSFFFVALKGQLEARPASVFMFINVVQPDSFKMTEAYVEIV